MLSGTWDDPDWDFSGSGGRVKYKGRTILIVAAVGSCVAFADSRLATAAGSPDVQSMYLHGPAHSSLSLSAAITPANVAGMGLAWHWTPDPPLAGHPQNELFSSPAVANNTVFVGSNSGEFYAINLITGSVVWQRDLGYVPKLTCQSRGTSASPAVLPDPTTGLLTVYEAGGDGYLYALDAATGAIRWKSEIHVHSPGVNDWFDWSSPTILHGRVYVGLTSQCDKPLTRGGVKEFSQATGKVLAVYHAVPRGVVGGGVWSTVAAVGLSVFATTGTPPPFGKPPGTDAVSVVRLNAKTLVRQDRWTVPLAHPGTDQDFGASPVVFTSSFNGRPTRFVGAMNKNGIFYAWRTANLHAGPVWRHRIDNPVTPSIPAAVWSGAKRLWVAGNTTTINGTSFKGSVRSFTVTGKVSWQRGLPAAVLGTPSLNSAGILAVATYDSLKGVPISNPANGCYLLNAGTGAILRSITTGGSEFAQPIFVGPYLLLATRVNGLYAYKV
jgi:hypothetical protein